MSLMLFFNVFQMTKFHKFFFTKHAAFFFCIYKTIEVDVRLYDTCSFLIYKIVEIFLDPVHFHSFYLRIFYLLFLRLSLSIFLDVSILSIIWFKIRQEFTLNIMVIIFRNLNIEMHLWLMNICFTIIFFVYLI